MTSLSVAPHTSHSRVRSPFSVHVAGVVSAHSPHVCASSHIAYSVMLVERKADKPRTLLGRKSELTYDLSVLDRNVRKRTAALRIECHSESYSFTSAGILTARSLLSGAAAVVAGGEDADCEDKAARQRDDEKQLPFHAYLPGAKNRPFSAYFSQENPHEKSTPNIVFGVLSRTKNTLKSRYYVYNILLFCDFSCKILTYHNRRVYIKYIIYYIRCTFFMAHVT